MNPQIAFLINQALKSLSAGNFKTTELYLGQALKLDPKNTHTLRFLGVTHAQQSQWEKALDFFTKSIKTDPNNAIAHSNIGNVFLELKQYIKAIASYDKALALEPKDAEIWSNKGNALTSLKRYDEALTHYDKALALNSQYAEAWSNKGNALNEIKEYKGALAAYQQAISLNPNFAKVWSSAGNSLTELMDYEVALAAYDKAISLDPKFAEAWSNKSNLLGKLKKYKEALECCSQALDLDQDYVPAWSNQAAYLAQLQDYNAAIVSANKAIELDPGLAEVWLNKGSILNYQAQYQEAIACFDRALELEPDYADALANKGVALYELLELDEAIRCCNRAIEIDPEHVDGHWNKGFAQLMLGNFDEGWINYEYRWGRKDVERYRHHHISRLSSLAEGHGKDVLVWSEQGFGDTLQFCRYIPILMKLGIKPIFEIPKPLIPLLKDQFNCQVIAQNEPTGLVDFQIPLLSLPLLLKTNLTSIPANVPYIQVLPRKVTEWSNKLPLSKQKLNIGIACSGNKNLELKQGNKRSMPLHYFSRLSEQHNIFLIQKDILDRDQSDLKMLSGIHLLGDLIENFEDSAAICENMDLIISVDTSLIHLAGAINKKVLGLLPFSSEWRWLASGDQSPWYPSATLFRQPSRGDWEAVIQAVETYIKNKWLIHKYSV